VSQAWAAAWAAETAVALSGPWAWAEDTTIVHAAMTAPRKRMDFAIGVFPGAYIARYLGPLPPSRGVHRGPSTSVALQSTQLGGFTRSSLPTRSYTPAGQTWL
jgi:hypothetical protein